MRLMSNTMIYKFKNLSKITHLKKHKVKRIRKSAEDKDK